MEDGAGEDVPTALCPGRASSSLAYPSFAFLGAPGASTVRCVEAVGPDVGEHSVREKVLHALALAQRLADEGGADVVPHGLRGHVDVVLVLPQDG